MNTIHLILITILVERDDVDATNAVQLLENAETNVLNVLYPIESLTPELRQEKLNTPLLLDTIDDLITIASQNGGVDIFKS